jgi:hypothetical protein
LLGEHGQAKRAGVGPDAVRGAEQVLSAMDHALTAAGHRSAAVAGDGAPIVGILLPSPAALAGMVDSHARGVTHDAVRRVVVATIDRVDVAHLHRMDFSEYLPPPGKPMLVTRHLPPASIRSMR